MTRSQRITAPDPPSTARLTAGAAGRRSRSRSARNAPLASASTLNSSPISCSWTELQRVGAPPGPAVGEQLADAAVEEKARLRRVADDVEPASWPASATREVEVRRDVLEADVDERIGVGAVGAVAHQRAARALRVVVLVLGKAVVDEEVAPRARRSARRRDKRRACGVQLGGAAGGKRRDVDRRPRRVGRSRTGERRSRRRRRRARASARRRNGSARPASRRAPRWRHDAGQRPRQRVEPAHAPRMLGRGAPAGARAGRRELDDRVAPHRSPSVASSSSRGAGAGAEFPDLVGCRLASSACSSWRASARPKSGDSSGAVTKSLPRPACDRRRPPARVVAEAGRIKRQRHEAARTGSSRRRGRSPRRSVARAPPIHCRRPGPRDDCRNVSVFPFADSAAHAAAAELGT